MADPGSLINLGQLSKPATVLVEKVCNAVGIIYEPTRIKRRARAEAEAKTITALAEVEVRDIEHRAVERFLHQEARKQENIERITLQATSKLKIDARVENIEEDWIAHFFNQCASVSDEQMQSLWASLLAGEASNAGTFSRRTINFASGLDKKDANLFTTFCQFVWDIDQFTPLIYDYTSDVYSKHGIDFASLKHLDDIGLISFDKDGSYGLAELKKQQPARYFGKQVLLDAPSENCQIQVGHALLTSVGRELSSISGSVPNQEFFEYTVARWIGRQFAVYSPFPQEQIA